jgi:hypothetical protein
VGAPGAPVETPEVAPRSHETAADEPGSLLPTWLAVVGGAVTIGFAVLLTRRYRRVNR